MTHPEVYEDRHRTRHLILGGVAGAITAALLLLLPQLQGVLGSRNVTPLRLVTLLVAGALGVLAIQLAMAAAFAGLEKRQAVVAWRNLLSWALYVLLLVMLAAAAGINLSALLLAGGVLSVIAAIASQNTLNNFFAGLVLLLVRPYRIGDSVYLRSGSFGGAQYEGLIVDVGSLYTTLSSNGELFRIPNSVVIGSVLVPDYKPLRADVALQLPSGLSLVQLEERLRGRLKLPPGARLFLVADQYAVQGGHPQVTVRLQIKAEEWLPAEDVMSAIDASVSELTSGESKPRLMDASDSGSG
jgi:small-conductance mechanosensitive channel